MGIGYQAPSTHAIKAPKMKSIPRPLLVPSQGVSGERVGMALNKYSVISASDGGVA